MSSGNGLSRGSFFILSLLIFFIAAIVVLWRLNPVKPIAVDTASQFSAEQAVKVLGTILSDQKPHPVDSEANSAVRSRIIDALKALGYQAEVQESTSCRGSQNYTCARVSNIIALHEGNRTGKLIMLSAHYDSVGAGPGVSDDGSGVSVLLEVARLLSRSAKSRNGVLFLFTDGEEPGLLGARAFATQNPLAKNVALAVNIEARGTSGQSALFETGDHSGWLIDIFAKSARHPFANSLMSAVYKLLPNDTDLSVWKSIGIEGLNFAYGDHVAYYHTSKDNLATLDHGSLQQQGDNVYDLVHSLVNADLPPDGAVDNAVYTDVLGAGMVVWPAHFSGFIATLLMVVYAWAHWRSRKGTTYSRAAVVRGFFLVPLSLVAGGLVAYLLTLGLSLLHGSSHPWHVDTAANRLFLWSSVLVVVFLLHRLVGGKAAAFGMLPGIGYAWLVAGLASALCLPGISYLFILPSTGLVVAMLLDSRARLTDGCRFLMSLPPALIAYVLLLQAIYLVEMMMGFNVMAGVVCMGALLGLAITFIAPLMPSDRPSGILRYGGLAALLLVATGALLSARAAAYSNEQPQALNILYLQRPNGDAYILASTKTPPSTVSHTMGAHPSVQQVFPEFHDSYFAQSVPSKGLAPARLDVVSVQQTESGRELRVRIDADASTQRVSIFFPKALDLHSIELDGQTLDYSSNDSDAEDYRTFVCRGDSCAGKEMTLRVGSKLPKSVWIEKFSPLDDIARGVATARDTTAVARQDGDQSIVLSAIDL